ncbi:MAG: hypothetical protein F6K18_30925 [Okeania sp. SIO2C2]|uniref:Tc toxin subunit A-related protein n=1 Tax=Okeania sp. SIO2C2 TaxID=2607787 RepID=UPI0013BBBF21|nr:LamG-like jellyroll fold domain-containing protein [Okeania sp. SIO2C2]NEP90868.1 hypothetical protein [Okeania sp. SIO2C2]
MTSDNDMKSKSISQKETPQTNGNGKRPLRQRIESALNKQDGFNKELARYGFNSSAEVAKCPSLTELIEKVKAKHTGEVTRENLPTFAFYRKARQREQLVTQVMRDVTVSRNPVSQGLRHIRPSVLPQAVARELATNQDSCLRFQGDNSYVTIPNTDNILDINGTSFTVECWAKRGNEDSEFAGNFFSQHGGTGVSLLVRAENVIGFYMGNALDSQSLEIDLNWHHYAFVYHSGQREIYRDGNLIEQVSDNNEPATSGDVRIGCHLTNNSQPWDGLIYEMRIWNHARTQQQIKENMNHPLLGNEEGLRNYWPMNEGTGTIIYDNTSSASNGTLEGSSPPQWVTATLPDSFEKELVRYAKPGSIQSSQSAAAYLKHIYDLAREQITPTSNKWALDIRRPDLADLELSEENLHKEITTLELVNEVLLGQLLNVQPVLHFQGVETSYVNVPNTEDKMNIFSAQSYTVECWAKPEKDIGDLRRLFSYGSPEGGTSSTVVTGGFSGKKLNFHISNESLVSSEYDDYKDWHHYAYVFNDADKKMAIYRDGFEIVSRTHTVGSNTNVTDFKIGTYGKQYFPGIIREMRIWNYARSEAETQRDMYLSLTGNESGLMNYWPLNEGLGEQVYDKTLRACHGNLAGSNKPVWGSGLTPENIFNYLKTQLHPLALPFNKELATVRTGLAQIEGMSVNAIARRFQEDDYALTQEYFTLVPHITDALNLLSLEVEKLQQNTSDNSNLFTEIFGSNYTEAELQYVDTFIEATSITFDEFRQLYRDYAVKDETGTSYSHNERGARFYADATLSLEAEGERLRMKVGGDYISAAHLAGMNHLVRLYKRTGFGFHQLDQLLCTFAAAHENRKVTDYGFSILAHCLYWHQQYNLSVDEFVGILREVNCYVRVGEQEEPTLMRKLFGKDAPYVTEKVLANSIFLTELEELTHNNITLGDILRRGLKVNRQEWDVILELVKIDDNTLLNQQTLSRLYRLATIFVLLGWDIISAIKLISKIDSDLLTTLAKSSDEFTTTVIPALEKLAWLSQWMETAELSVTDLLIVLTPPAEAVLQKTQQVSNFLDELNKAIEINLLNSESDFAIYRKWIGEPPVMIEIEDWLVQLQGKNILDNLGLVLSVTKDDIEIAVTQILTTAGVDIDINEELKTQLIDFLAETQSNQEKVLFEQVIKIAESENSEIVAPVLSWIDTDVYTALSTLLSGTESESEQLQLLYNLGRHLQLTSKLSFTANTVEMLCNYPEWLVTGMTTPLNLQQVYYLERFKQLQNAEASEDMWLAYFITHWVPEINSNQVNELLAVLLDFNPNEIQVLRDNATGADMKTVQQVEALSRQIQLCRDLSISATELITLTQEGVNDGTDNAAAAAVILGGLARSSDENLATLAENALNEKIRDALVAAYFCYVILPDPELRHKIKNTEDLYSYLLLDVNVTSAVPTSRIVEANSTVQLYIHRMLEGVESGTFVDKDAFRKEWETAQQYRVWEANEKLKLYPSSYIEPELRYDKTEIFKTFEQNLSQGHLDETMIETALYSYMQELQRLTELIPTGFCQVREYSPLGDTVNYWFTAKAAWTEMTYYYRQMRLDVELLKVASRQAAQWGEWKKIDLPATHQTVFGINPAYAWNRLFLMWIELEERRSDDGTETTYHLIPRYLRQGVDGSFGEPLTPDISDDVDLTVDEGVVPTLYQANFQEGKISLFFTTPGEHKYLFEITQTKAIIDNTTRTIPTVPELSGYIGTQSIYATDEAQAVISPSQNQIYVVKENFIFAGGSMIDLIIREDRFEEVDYPFILNYSILDDTDELKIELSRHEIAFDYGSSFSQDTSVSNLKYKVFFNGILKDQKDGEISFTERENYTYHHYRNHVVDSGVFFVINIEYEVMVEIKVMVCFDFICQGGMGVEDTGYYQTYANPLIYYQLTESVTDYMYLEESGDRKQEAYLVSKDTTHEGSTHIFHLVSPALRNVPELLPLPAGVLPLFSLDHQSYPETGVDNFVDLADANGELNPILHPKPKNKFDFDGPMGLYGWEVFYHIPALLASKYADNGDYDQAKRWLRCIYDPSSTGNPWGVRPLITDEVNNSFSSITDPDEEAVRNPIHYQHATIRHSIENLLSQGDDSYRQETQETLQEAKMWYVVAKNNYQEEFRETLEILTASDWENPTLGEVTEADFRDPTNEELLALYDTIEERLHNLRHWLSIDGEPLNIPLLAPPIDPQSLQMAALSGVPATAAQSFAQMALPYTFDEILARAKDYTKQLTSFTRLLQKALEKRDDRLLQEIKQQNEYDLFQFKIKAQEEAVTMVEVSYEALEYARNVLQVEHDGRKKLAGEFMNELEATSYGMSTALTALHGVYAGAAIAGGGLSLIPNIYGLAVGGQDMAGFAEATKDVTDFTCKFYEEMMDLFQQAGEYMRRQDEAKIEYDVLVEKIKEIDFDISDSSELRKEQEILRQLESEREKSKYLVQFHQSRFTNSQFYDWYVGHITNLYRSTYDVTVKFAKMAETAFRIETNDPAATFIGSHWDQKTKGLLCGQALWLDLERMDYAYWSLMQPETSLLKEISLQELDPSSLASLQSRGQTIFCLKEELFEEDDPTLYGRKIQSIRVSIPALENQRWSCCGRLTQIDSRLYYSRHKDANHSIFNPYAYQSIVLGGWQTDSSKVKLPKGRLKPFQGTGVDSTWHLSFPTVVKAIGEKRRHFPQKEMLKLIDDVVIEVTYSAKM